MAVMKRTRRKRGRPTMDPKPVKATFRLGPGDITVLQDVAHELGGNLSEALRHLLREHAKRRSAKKGGTR
jgi:hypothetical protein